MTSHGWVFDGWMGHQGQFFPIQRELLFIFDKITYYLCLICNGRKKEKERDREMKLPHRGKCCQGKASIFFFFWFVVFFVCLFEISPLFPYEVFFDQNYLSLNKKSPCRNVFAPKMFSEDTLIYVKKPFRMTFH